MRKSQLQRVKSKQAKLHVRTCGDRWFTMKRKVSNDSPHIPESIPYIIQNLRVHGTPKLERGLDPLIETILSQSTTNANSGHLFLPQTERVAAQVMILPTGLRELANVGCVRL